MTPELMEKVKNFFGKFILEGYSVASPYVAQEGDKFEVGMVTHDEGTTSHHKVYEGPSPTQASEIYTFLGALFDMFHLGKRTERNSFEESSSNYDETQI